MFGSKKKKKQPIPTVQPAASISQDTVKLDDMSLTITPGDGSVLRLGNAQHQGRRPYQEDSCGYSNLSDTVLTSQKGVLAVLADGMGGLSKGKEVSTAVVRGMIDYFNQHNTVCSGGSDLLNRAETVNDEICRKYCPSGRVESGSTLVCAQIFNHRLHWLCVGDSRLYLCRGEMMYQINEDHDYLNQLLQEAILEDGSVSEAFSDPQKDVLVRCMGNRDLSFADASSDGLKLQNGDKLLLCSDGVYNALPLQTINTLMKLPPQSAAQCIADAVVAQKIRSQDNLTIVIIQYN
ncbi:MAG: serine/threonine-protein phosphatase [Clostridiales bacterium]|nr:serine/threonine-protein phosphatase [Clostridiales bacterium]